MTARRGRGRFYLVASAKRVHAYYGVRVGRVWTRIRLF